MEFGIFASASFKYSLLPLRHWLHCLFPRPQIQLKKVQLKKVQIHISWVSLSQNFSIILSMVRRNMWTWAESCWITYILILYLVLDHHQYNLTNRNYEFATIIGRVWHELLLSWCVKEMNMEVEANIFPAVYLFI